MKFELDPLPYALDALEPHISARTLDFHYNKHHRGYMSKLESALEGKPAAEKSLEEIMLDSSGSLFNNAAQVWNHTFYWNSMSPDGGAEPSAAMAELLERHFGGLSAFKQEFASVATGEFGSGWAWLVKTAEGTLEILSTHDAENPLRRNLTPLLTLDVWEHAYYLDYQNDRSQYVAAFLDHLIDWSFAEANLESG